MTRTIVRYAAAGALAAGTLLSTAAFAQEPGYEAAQMSVRTADVNLATVEGRATIERRIRYAVSSVCSNSGDMSLAAATHARACATKAITIAQRDLDTAVAQAKTGTQVASLAISGSANAQ